MNKPKRVLTGFGLFVCIGFLVASYIGPRMIIQINNEFYKSKKANTDKWPLATDYDLLADELTFVSDEGWLLKGLIIRTDSSVQKGTIIMVHGIRSYKDHFIPHAKRNAIRGFNTVLFDLRAHGESEGKYCTFGNKEKYDISILLDSLDAKTNLNHNYIIWGHSLGAAVALQTLSIDERIKVGIIESTFSSYRQIVHDYAARTLGFHLELFIDYCIWLTEQIGDFKADETVPSMAAKLIHQPILMVHGEKDSKIKIEYARENFANLASDKKVFLAIPGANHVDVWKTAGQKYFDRVYWFIETNIHK